MTRRSFVANASLSMTRYRFSTRRYANANVIRNYVIKFCNGDWLLSEVEI
jgi:hypothetical protein